MERIYETETKEIKKESFKSVDGLTFKTAGDCEEHEKMLKTVLIRHIVSMGKLVSDYDAFMVGCEDYLNLVIKIDKDNIEAIATLRNFKYFDGTSEYAKSKDIRDYVGETVVFAVGWVPSDLKEVKTLDNFYLYGEIEDFKKAVAERLSNALTLD